MKRGWPIPTALGLGLALLLSTGPIAPRASAQQQDSEPVLVEVTAATPLSPAPDGTITVEGLVSNRSDRTLSNIQALLRVSGDPLRNRSEVVAVADLTTPRRGVAVEATITDVAPELAPAASAPITVTAPVAALPLGRNGVYAFFLEVRSSAGRFTTSFPLPWFPAPDAIDPSRIVVMNPIRAAVDLTATGTLQSDALTASMEPGGPLYSYAAAGAAAAAAGVPITWLIDPAVTAAASDVASGSAGFADPRADPTAARAQADDWLQRLSAGSSAPSAWTYLTPYAEVDATAVIEAGMPNLLQEAIRSGPDAAAASVPVRNGMLGAPPAGNAGAAALQAYADAAVSNVVLSEAVLPPTKTLTYTPSGVAAVSLADGAETTAIIPDNGLGLALQRPAATAAERFRLQAGILAEAAMLTLELPISSRTVVMLPPADAVIPPDVYAGVLTALNEAPYISLVGLPALLEPDVPRVDRLLQPVVADPPPLSGSYLAPIPPLESRLGAFEAVTVEPPTFAPDFRAALLRGASANWRADLDRGSALLDSIDTDLSSLEQQVTTVSTGSVTFTGSTGTLPLTISNGLQQAVDVGVVLQADPAFRLTYTPPGLVQIGAGKRVSIEIPVEVFGSGPLPVSVLLTDRDGRPFIETGDLVIRATAASRIAALVVLVGAVALLVLVFWRFRRKGAEQS